VSISASADKTVKFVPLDTNAYENVNACLLEGFLMVAIDK
jgi:hypothetical protein